MYSRKSKFTGKGESIENQIIKCKKFIEFKFEINPEEAEIFVDEGFSGKNEARPHYQDMLKKIKNKEIDSIIIYQLNRLGRNARDIHNTMQLCEDLGCIIYSATEGFDSSTSFGRAIIGILASLAQLEREQLAERVKDNMYTLAKMGRWLGGQSPLGFQGVKEYYIDENGKERSITKLKENKEELKLVKVIYNKYLELRSLSQVSKWALESGLKGKNGGYMDKSIVNSILQNPVYVKSDENVMKYFENKGYEVCGVANGNGLLRYGGKDEQIVAVAKHKGIIAANTWIKIQEILKENTEKGPKTGKTHNALLTGILRCGKCGSTMGVIHGASYKGIKTHYYKCNLKIKSPKLCDSKNLNVLEFEEKFFKFLKNYNREELIKSLQKSIQEESQQIENMLNINNINKEIERINKTTKHLLNKLKIIDNDEVAKIIIDEITCEKNRLNTLKNKKAKSINEQNKLIIAETEILKTINDLDDFNNSFCELSHEQKQIRLKDLLESINYKENTFEIKLRIKKTY
ncbi:MAG: recombinase family protein [Clostridium sp.]